MAVFVFFNATQIAHAQATTALPLGQTKVFNDDLMYFNIAEDEPPPTCGSTTAGAGNGATGIGAGNVQIAFNYFVTTRGLTPSQSGGIVGNLMVEDPGLIPETVQGGRPPSDTPTGPGYGIAQWSPERQQGLIALAATEAPPNNKPNSLITQLDYVWQELNTTHKAALADLKANTVYDSFHDTAYNNAISIMLKYEAPAEKAIKGPNAVTRGGNADQLVARYGGSVGTAVPVSTGAIAGTCAGTDAAVACTGPAPTPSSGVALSALRQDVVCRAQAELKVWQAPGVKPAELCNKYGAGVPCEQWCADFVSWIFDQAKYPLQPDPDWRVASVQGVWNISKLGTRFHFHPAAGYSPKPGDIVIHKEGGTSHTNIVVAVSGTTITMIGGDQGSGPYGGPNSKSVVSQVIQKGVAAGDTTGYVTPD